MDRRPSSNAKAAVAEMPMASGGDARVIDGMSEVQMNRLPSAQDYLPIGESDQFDSRLQAIKTRHAVKPELIRGEGHKAHGAKFAEGGVQGPEGQDGRPGPFICAFTPKYAKYSLKVLKDLDTQLRADCFPQYDPSELPMPDEVERWFWERMASESDARILYCSDLDGTAFPHTGTYGEHAWSLQRLADAERSLLRFVEYAIPGVNTPMLYFGMLFAMFCWHVEDQYMYSTSYLHEGACKTWYGVPSAHAAAFEAVFSESFGSNVEVDPELFVKKASMVPPWLLSQRGIPVCRAVQEPGQYVVTLPMAYHAGFSHGFNTAEAVNFMLHDWLPYAVAAAERYRLLAKEPVIDFDAILVRASEADHSNTVHALLAQLVVKELEMRDQATDSGVKEVPMTNQERSADLGRSPPCSVCGHVCHFSYIQRGQGPTRTNSPPHRPKGNSSTSRYPFTAPTLVCLRCMAHLTTPHTVGEDHIMDSEGGGGREGGGRGDKLHLVYRYTVFELSQMAERAAKRMREDAEVHHIGDQLTLDGPTPHASQLPAAVDRSLSIKRDKAAAKRLKSQW